MNPCIVYLASRLDDYNSILSTGESRFEMTCLSLKNVTKHLKLPVIMFHEDFTAKEKNIMKSIYNNISFEIVDFIRPDIPFKQKPCKTSGKSDGICMCQSEHKKKNPKAKCFRPKGYLMMCRFFSGVMQSHPALEKYDSYFRFDDDSFLIEPFLDQKQFLKQFEHIHYGLRSIFFERNDQTKLFQFTKEFCERKKLPFYKIANLLESRAVTRNGIYSGIAPYNNFHFCKLDLWKHPIIKSYVEELEKINGCLVQGWMDANIHAMIAFVLCPIIGLPINNITNFGYRHTRHFSILHRVNIVYKDNERFFPLY